MYQFSPGEKLYTKGRNCLYWLYLHVASFFTAHLKSIRGIAVDSANLKVVSGSLDGFIKVGNFCSFNCYY